MKSVLFIIPSYSTGGTISSLISILNTDLCQCYDIKTFAIVSEGEYKDVFARFDIGHNRLTTAYRIHRKNVQLLSYPLYLLVRMIDIVSSKMRLDFDGWINRRTYQRILKTKDYDTIVAFSEGLATRFVSQMNHPKKIAWIHCDYARCVKNVEKESEIYSSFEKIVCVSEYTRKSFCNIFSKLDLKTVSISNLLDSENILRLSEEPIEDTRFRPDLFTLLSVGRISAVKRYSSIPPIARKILDCGKSFRWYVIGPVAETEEYDNLVKNIQHYHVEDCVILLGAKNNPYPYFTKASVLISLSSSEACPMIFNEAKVLKTPIVSADFGSAFEFIEQGHDGYITSIGKMPQVLIELMENEDKLQTIRKNEYKDGNSTIIAQLNQLFKQ